jgi:disulfide bond formation protein DsbB
VSILPSTRRVANLIGVAATVLLMAVALYFQYARGLEPCNMCILQRIATITLGVVFLVAGLHDPGRLGARVYAILIAVAAGALVALAARHVWMQLQPLGSLPSCGADFYTMVGMMPFVEVVQRIVMGGGDCQAIGWSFLGISIPGWLLVAAVLLGFGGVTANLVLGRAHDHR